MSPALLAALELVWPCPVCGSLHVTVTREHEIVPHFRPGEKEMAGYDVEALVVRAGCSSCHATVYRRVEGVGYVDEYRAAPEPNPAPPSRGFGLLEVA